METQLVLLEASPNWKLDRRTREIGRRGVAQARAALRVAAERRAAATASALDVLPLSRSPLGASALAQEAVTGDTPDVIQPGRRTAA